MSHEFTLIVIAAILAAVAAQPGSADEPRMAVIVDTDLGTEVDDAFALGLVVASGKCELLGVTTCTGQAADRAWMVCRLLTALGLEKTPVAAGRGPQPESEIDWQIQYRRHPAVVWNRTSKPLDEAAEDVMHRLLAARDGGVTLLCLGPLTNAARLLEKYPGDKARLARIVLMGGSLRTGYDGRAGAVAEWNIASDAAAARTVFDSGVPLVVAPLDATAKLQWTAALRQRLFAAHTPLVFELQNLYELSSRAEPTMHDPLAAWLAIGDGSFCQLQPLRLSVDDAGQTRIADGPPNARVAVACDAAAFLEQLVQQLAGFGEPVLPQPPGNPAHVVARRGLPRVVHVFEDYETDIEKRWWMSGKLETGELPAGSQRGCRAVLTQDFDGKLGDGRARYRAVIFNPVPGPPMGSRPRLSFRYRLRGSDTLRVQIFSLSNGYHRYLSLRDLPQGRWAEATVDMTQARRPDGSGGPLSADERIDDIQFYVDPRAELLIDSMVLYDEAAADETRPFPRRWIYTGWFDTGQQGREWPGDFEIVLHEKPRGWDAARSVVHPDSGRQWIRLSFRGRRPAGHVVHCRFEYKLAPGGSQLKLTLRDSTSGRQAVRVLTDLATNRWAEQTVEFELPAAADSTAGYLDELILEAGDAPLLIDNVLVYEPAADGAR